MNFCKHLIVGGARNGKACNRVVGGGIFNGACCIHTDEHIYEPALVDDVTECNICLESMDDIEWRTPCCKTTYHRRCIAIINSARCPMRCQNLYADYNDPEYLSHATQLFIDWALEKNKKEIDPAQIIEQINLSHEIKTQNLRTRITEQYEAAINKLKTIYERRIKELEDKNTEYTIAVQQGAQDLTRDIDLINCLLKSTNLYKDANKIVDAKFDLIKSIILNNPLLIEFYKDNNIISINATDADYNILWADDD